MAFSKARRLSDFIAADGTIPTGKFASSSITSSHLVDGTIAHADLHTDMDLTGKTVLVANASTGDSDTTAANTAFVQQEIAALVDSSPGTLNTLNELAAALGDDANFSTTITNSIATKLPLAGGTMTGGLNIHTSTSQGLIVRTTANAEPFVALQRNSGSNGVAVLRSLNGGSLAIDTGATGAGQTTALTIDSSQMAHFEGNLYAAQSIYVGDDVRLSSDGNGELGIGYGQTATNNRFTVYNNTTAAFQVKPDGRVHVPHEFNVGVDSGTNSSKLRVHGHIVAGDVGSTSGDVLFEGYYGNGATVVLGSERSSGGVFIGYGVQPSTSTQHQFLSSTPVALTHGAYVAADTHRWWTASSGSAVTVGNQVTTMVERMIITSDGKVGIGIDAPGFALHVRHATTNVVARFESQDNQVWIDLHDDGSGNYGALLGHDSDNNILFRVANADVDDKLILSPSGNLTIAGQLELIDGNNYIVADQSTATRIDFYLNNTVAGAWKRTGSGGSIRPNQYSSGDTAANLPALASYDDEDTGVFFPEADKVGFSAGGNNIFTVKNTGQIEARGEVTGTRIVASVQDMFNMGAEKSEHPMITGTGRTYVDGGSSNYQGYRFATENFFPPVFIPYSPNQVYRVSASLYQLQGSTASGGANSRHYFGLAGYDENFNFLQTDGIGTYQYILGSNFTLSTGSTQEMDVTMKGWQGSGGTDGNKMDQGTVYIRPLALINYQSAGALAVLTGFNIMPAGTVADNDSNAGTNY